MPYNTRRKSVSLASLGIQVPQPAMKSAKHATLPSLPSPFDDTTDQPPSKRVKRVHHEFRKVSTAALEPTPPPSPPATQVSIHDEDIRDDIVSGAVRVLEKAGNRPHTVKELANLLASEVGIVGSSSNPQAIISSRLNIYLKRNDFTKEKPCLLEKKLTTVHPRRTYFYLSTMEPVPSPDYFNMPTVVSRAIISPAPTDEEAAEEEEERRRRIPSPSPELDDFHHEYEEIKDIQAGNSVTSIISRDHTTSPSLRNSPPLEGDEQEFSDSAISLSMKHRSASRDLREGIMTPPVIIEEEATMEHESHATPFFTNYSISTSVAVQISPLVQPISPVPTSKLVLATSSPAAPRILSAFAFADTDGFANWDLKMPEAVELDELDDLLGKI